MTIGKNNPLPTTIQLHNHIYSFRVTNIRKYIKWDSQPNDIDGCCIYRLNLMISDHTKNGHCIYSKGSVKRE